MAFEEDKSRGLHLRRLIDRWTPRSVSVLLFLKLLQFVRYLGVSAEKHGWRKVASIFVRNEYSKFMLAALRLRYAEDKICTSAEEANKLLIPRLYDFLNNRPELKFTVKIGKFSFSPCENKNLDIIEATIDHKGNIVKLNPHFDPAHPPLLNASVEQIRYLMKEVVETSNAYRYEPSLRRLQLIRKALRAKAARASMFRFAYRSAANKLIDRILSAVFVCVEVLPDTEDGLYRKRFTMPDVHRLRHPGWGLLCIIARYTSDFSEADLWCHFNHTLVDGAPMQEMLLDLKAKWGTAGPFVYPALESPLAAPLQMFCGDGVYRMQCFLDFEPLIRIRKRLNARFVKQMNGKASIGAMIMWCLAQHSFFRSTKMLMPVDAGELDGHRELGILVIRPQKYEKVIFLRGFLHFQREINLRMTGIREGKTESHEFLVLCSMLHPMLYHLAAKIIAPTLNDIVGTLGLSILRDSDIFISPMTDMQTDGFISLGRANVPTQDGKTAGLLCFSGAREHLKDFQEAVENMRDPDKFFSP